MVDKLKKSLLESPSKEKEVDPYEKEKARIKELDAMIAKKEQEQRYK